jgi:hypothetical protein
MNVKTICKRPLLFCSMRRSPSLNKWTIHHHPWTLALEESTVTLNWTSFFFFLCLYRIYFCYYSGLLLSFSLSSLLMIDDWVVDSRDVCTHIQLFVSFFFSFALSSLPYCWLKYARDTDSRIDDRTNYYID